VIRPAAAGRRLADPQRLLTLAWLVGLILVGQNHLGPLSHPVHATPTAHAAQPAAQPTAQPDPSDPPDPATGGDSLLVGPDLARGAPLTLFETYDLTAYTLTVRPDDDNSGWFGTGAAVLHLIGWVDNLLLWICLGILYGALVLLQWFLGLTLYRDAAADIDAAVLVLADQVFWPLIGATTAIGAFLAYARWRGEGRGVAGDLGWVLAAAGLGAVIASGPSALAVPIDQARQDLAGRITAGTAQYTASTANPVGFPQPTITGDPATRGTRALVDSTWNSFGATAWCYAQFRSLDVCHAAGRHALAQDEQWQQWMRVLDDHGAVPEFGPHGDWIRGQDPARTGYLLLLAVITIPAGALLLRLVVAGLAAVTGFLLLLIVGLVFLTLLPIPGWCRETGVRCLVHTLGTQLQALVLTVVISGITVVSTILARVTAGHGFLLLGVLTIGLFLAAARTRAWLDVLTTSGSGSLGFGTALLLRSALRTVTTAVTTTLGGGAHAVGFGGRILYDRGRAALHAGPGWGRQPGSWTAPWGVVSRTIPRPEMLTDLDNGPGRPGGPVRARATRLRAGRPSALPGSGNGRPGGADPDGPTNPPNSPGGPGRGPTPRTPGGGSSGEVRPRPAPLRGGAYDIRSRRTTDGTTGTDSTAGTTDTPGPADLDDPPTTTP
jgi:hypothetical protein